MSAPPASSLEGTWIEVFRAGDYAERGVWTPEQLEQLAATYDPRRHAAPVVLGHPADDAPAYAWVRRLRRAGASLWAQLEKVDPAFEALLRAGRFAQRSVALYTHFPATGGPYLRHLGFLGAAPPGVKGLAPVRFVAAPSIAFAFDTQPASISLSPAAPAAGSSEVQMPEPKSKLESFLDHLRAFFAPAPDSGLGRAGALVLSEVEGCPPPDDGQAQGLALPKQAATFVERLAALEQRLDALTARSRAVTPSEAEGRLEGFDPLQVANFVETLRSRGRFPPLYDRLGVKEFMERLAAADTRASSTEQRAPEPEVATSIESKPDAQSTTNDNLLLVWFQEFLAKLPAVIEFRELSSSASHGSRATGRASRLVHFTEPRRGMSVDPASVELAERAEALAAELGISYAQALAQLREERRTSPATA